MNKNVKPTQFPRLNKSADTLKTLHLVHMCITLMLVIVFAAFVKGLYDTQKHIEKHLDSTDSTVKGVDRLTSEVSAEDVKGLVAKLHSTLDNINSTFWDKIKQK